jgi:hypothetical protein
MMRSQHALKVVGIGAVVALAAAVSAQEPNNPPDFAPVNAQVNKERIDAALELTQQEAAKYAMTLGDEANSVATLRKDPVLKWSNPAAGEIHGNVYLWTVNDRPVAVGSLFKWFSPHTHMSQEFHSLAEVPLKGSYAGRQVWTTREAGVTFAPIEDAPRPAASTRQRLVQMRHLAKDFAATKKARDEQRQELRLLPQPIYRYAAPQQDVLDGGLFVFVQGTDPEVFLLLEARGEADEALWTFSAARMNSVGFHLRLKDREVWTKEIMPWGDVSSHGEIYTSFMFKMP